MTVASPWVLWTAIAAAVGVLLSHLLSVRKPPLLLLPTTRFLPPRTVRAVSMSARPTDLLLLILRTLAVLCAGLAFAGVQWAGAREPVLTMLVIDAAAADDDSLAWRASIDGALQQSPPAAVVLSDGQLIMTDSVTQASGSLTVVPSRSGSLASALLAARRSAPRIAQEGDSIALLLVSPLRADASTDALDTARALWPGRIAVIPVVLPSLMGAARDVQVNVRSADQNDAVVAAFARWSSLAQTAVRVVRDSVSNDDVNFARTGGVLVVWPARFTATDSLQAPAVIANGRALVARGLTPITRIDSAGIGSSSQSSVERSVRTIAWWPNGNAAATERVLGNGCVREVLFSAPAGDALLSVSARGVLSALSAPCGVAAGMGTRPALTEAQTDRLRGDGPLASAATFRATNAENQWARWLLLASVICLLVEMFARRRTPVPVQ